MYTSSAVPVNVAFAVRGVDELLTVEYVPPAADAVLSEIVARRASILERLVFPVVCKADVAAPDGSAEEETTTAPVLQAVIFVSIDPRLVFAVD
jgi:hypothetical protein